MTRQRAGLVSIARNAVLPNGWDLIAFALVVGLLATFAVGAREMTAPAAPAAVTLDPHMLPYYALRTTLRMLIALVASLGFSLVYGVVAAKSRRAGAVLVPILDILQSVPVLGFLSVTVTFFIALFPGSTLGPECASMFAIFTSQAWNMTFSVYQSVRTIPRDLDEAARAFGLTWWQRLWRLDVPFAVPGLVWNAMMSMSGGWFFVVASEAITVGTHTVTLPGIGSFIAEAIAERRLDAIGWAVAAMLVVIVAYDQLLFRPATAWADRFRVEQTAGQLVGTSWVLALVRRGRVARALMQTLEAAGAALVRAGAGAPRRRSPPSVARGMMTGVVWWGVVAAAALWGARALISVVAPVAGAGELVHVAALAGATLARVAVLMLLATLVWVPIGVWIGLRPRRSSRRFRRTSCSPSP